QLSLIVIPLMIVMQYLRDLGWLKVISNKFAPFTRFLGMKENTSFTLVTGLTIGLALGAGVMIQAVQEDGVATDDMMIALIFLVTCRAVAEETGVFIPLGIAVWALLVIRSKSAVAVTVLISYIWNRAEELRVGELKNEY